MKRFRKNIITVTSIFALTIGLAYGSDDEKNFNELDKNGDNNIEANEFEDCRTMSAFSQWDTDADHYLSPLEFYDAQFSIIDKNDNDTIEGDEWNSMVTFMPMISDAETDNTESSQHRMHRDENMMHHDNNAKKDETQYDKIHHKYSEEAREKFMQSCKAWDINKDQKLSYKEFETVANEKNFFGAWDADDNGKITESEMTQVAFNIWDTNNNGLIDRDEFKGYDQLCTS